MTDRELEQRLHTALDHAAPNDLQGILSRCGDGKGTVIDMNETRSSVKRKPWKGLIAACLALVLLAGGGGIFYQQAYAVASVVSLDVNPSIQLEVNRNEKVLSCTALNQEAVTALADMNGGKDLEGAKLTVAVNAIVGALVRCGYLDRIDSAILISVEDKDADRAARLQQTVVSSVDGVLQEASAQVSVASQIVSANADLSALAQRNNISTGKANLVERVIALNGELGFDELAGLSVEELQDLLEIGAPAMPIGCDAALQAVLDYAGITGDSVTYYEVDPELDEGTPYYEVELVIDGREQDYGVHAFTGEVIRGIDGPSVMNPGPALPQGTVTVTEAEAEAAALAHAGLTQDQVSGMRVKRDFDDGRMEFEVKFFTSTTEYEYTVDASTGEILKAETETIPGMAAAPTAAPTRDPLGSAPQQVPAATPAPVTDIGAEAAKQAALAHAGLTADQVSRMKVEQDREHGRLEYEVEFKSGGYEYEYTIDAATGAVLDFDKDWDD